MKSEKRKVKKRRRNDKKRTNEQKSERIHICAIHGTQRERERNVFIVCDCLNCHAIIAAAAAAVAR